MRVERKTARRSRQRGSIFGIKRAKNALTITAFVASLTATTLAAGGDRTGDRTDAEAIAQRWLLPDGIRLPAHPARVEEQVFSFERASLYGAVPDARLTLSGVEGAMVALGRPCTEGGLCEERAHAALWLLPGVAHRSCHRGSARLLLIPSYGLSSFPVDHKL